MVQCKITHLLIIGSMKNDIPDKIRFRAVSGLNTYADARDVYYWIRLRDKEMAEAFRIKFEKSEKELQRELKKTYRLTAYGQADTWNAVARATEPEKAVENMKKPWYKF